MKRIHIFGASGSGTSTLGKAFAEAVGGQHLDADNYFWLPTDPPFQTIRQRFERQELLRQDFVKYDAWVLSGSICGWGDFAISTFDLVVFLWLPPGLRMQRLKQRERERYGPAIEDSTDPRHQNHREFLEWAAAYDTGGLDMRSRLMHEEWMTSLPCPVIRVENVCSIQESLSQVMKKIKEILPNG